MNANEKVIIDRMAECLENGEQIRYRFAILHTGTQQDLLARVPYLLQDMSKVERLNAIIQLLAYSCEEVTA